MENIPIEQMDERRLRAELSSAWTANQLLNTSVSKLKDLHIELLEENRSLRKANLSFAPKQIKLAAENKVLNEKLELLDALEAAGVDNWEGYDEAIEILRKNRDEK